MKRKILISLAVLIVVWIGYRGYRIGTSSSKSPGEKVHFSFQGLEIDVTYSRPYKKGRVIFGEAKDRPWLPKGNFWTTGFRLLTGLPRTTGALVPDGQYWRLGANDATEVSLNKNIHFAGMAVHAGKYRMYAVPNHDSWRISLNSELGQFGYFEPNHSVDVVSVEVPVEVAPSETEQFTINFESDSSEVKMNFFWDKTRVRVPIRIQD